jgi:hypothetical protein
MKTRKEKSNQHFGPEKCRMIYCPSCRGTGKSPNGEEGVMVCSQCGGFGWVKKEGDDK